jgi:hypothetical protein
MKNSYEEEKRSMFAKVAPVVFAAVLSIVSVVYIVCRTLNNRAYHEKWKDYDGCGVG